MLTSHVLQLDIQTREYISLCVHPTNDDDDDAQDCFGKIAAPCKKLSYRKIDTPPL